MKLILAFPLILLTGCTGLSGYQATSTDDAIRIVKEAGGTGCYYYRATGSARPYADVDGSTMVVSTLGKGNSYLDCLQAIPPEQRALMMPK